MHVNFRVDIPWSSPKQSTVCPKMLGLCPEIMGHCPIIMGRREMKMPSRQKMIIDNVTVVLPKGSEMELRQSGSIGCQNLMQQLYGAVKTRR